MFSCASEVVVVVAAAAEAEGSTVVEVATPASAAVATLGRWPEMPDMVSLLSCFNEELVAVDAAVASPFDGCLAEGLCEVVEVVGAADIDAM